MARLRRNFFARPTLQVARDLLGQRLVRVLNGQRLAGLITETEAYIGEDDRACHARAGRTRRNASMYGPPGHAYVYFTYGMHFCLNIVTEHPDFPAAVLIRAIAPTEGLETMRQNRDRPDAVLTNGPAKLTQALGINGTFDGRDLCAPGADLFLEAITRRGARPPIIASPRVGLGQSVPEPWKSQAWNFRASNQ